MARLPTYVDLGEAPSARSGRAVAEVDLTGVARGVRDFGSGLQDAGKTLYAEARRNQSEADDIETARARAKWSTDRVNLEGSFRPDDPNYTQWGERYRTESERIRQEAAAGIRDPQRRERFLLETQPQVATGAQRIQGLVDGRNRDAGIAGLNGTLEQTRDAALKTNDDAERERLISSGSQAIENAIQRGFIGQEQGRALRQRWTTDYRTAVIRALPAEERAIALATNARLSANAQSDYQFFVSKGWSPQAAAALVGNMQQESGGHTTARNAGDGRDGSDSIGLFQWNADRARRLQAFAAARGKAVTDRTTQLEFLDNELRTTERSAGERLAAASDVREATRAAISALRPAGWSSSNPEGGHGFGARYRNAATALHQFGGGPAPSPYRGSSMAAGLPEDTRRALELETERELFQQQRQQDAARREEAQRTTLAVQDDIASMERTGQGAPPERLNRETVARSMGEEGARAWEVQRARARRVFEATDGIESLPEGEIERRLQGLQPQPGAEGYVEDTQAYERARRRADAIREARARDPALASERIPSVAEARQQAQYDETPEGRSIRPESAQAIVRARLAAQQQLGIREAHAVTVSEGRAIARQLRFIGEDDGAGLERFITSLRRTYGDFADEVLVSSLQLANVNRDLGVAAVAVLNRLVSAATQQERQSALQMLSAPIPVPRPTDTQMAAEAYSSPIDPMGQPSQGGRVFASEADAAWLALRSDPQAPNARTLDEIARRKSGASRSLPQAPPATYDGADLRRLYEGRGNPEIVGAFEQKYGRGAASAALTDILRRLGGSDNDR